MSTVQSPPTAKSSAPATAAMSSSSSAIRSTNTRINRFNILNLVAYIANTVVTYGIGVGGWFGRPGNTELSLKYQTLVTPIGWAFSIWAFIFLFQLIWVFWQLAIPSQRNSPYVTVVNYYYVFICIAQIGWTISFSFEVIWLSMVFMAGICLFLWRTVQILKSVGDNTVSIGKTILNYFLWKLPFTLHAGWITAATAVNANVVIVDYGFETKWQFLAAVVSLIILFLVAIFTTFRSGSDLVIPLVIAWALFGVYKELEDPEEVIATNFSDSQVQQTQWASLGAAIAMCVGVLLKIVLALRQRRSQAVSDEESRYLRAE